MFLQGAAVSRRSVRTFRVRRRRASSRRGRSRTCQPPASDRSARGSPSETALFLDRIFDSFLGSGRRLAPDGDKPLRDELLSIERLEERARSLAARFTVDPSARRMARSVFPRFDDNARALRDAYRALGDDFHRGEFVTPAAEWLLDNYHLVASEIRQVRQNLPRGYYRELPKLVSREHAGEARVYALAVELIRHSDSRLDRPQLVRFLDSFQTRRAPDDRRALGLAEHAEARPHREPPPHRGRDAGRARGTPRRRRLLRRGSEGASAAAAARRCTSPRSSSSSSARESTARGSPRCAAGSTSTSPRRG